MKQKNRTMWRRVCATLVACGLVLGLGMTVAQPVEPVEAAWTSSQSAAGTVTAGVVPAPTDMTCQINSLLGAVISITLTWKSAPVDDRAFKLRVGAGKSPAKFTDISSADIVQVSGQPNTYQVTLTATLLGTLLTGLLGSSNTIRIVSSVGENWESSPSDVELFVPLLGVLIGSSCTPVTTP